MKSKKTIIRIKTVKTLLAVLLIGCAAIFGSGAVTASAVEYEEIVRSTGVTVMADDAGSRVSGWIDEHITPELKNIGRAVAVVAVICVGILLIGGGGQALQKAKPVAIAILVGIVVIGLGPDLIDTLWSI